MTSPTTITPQPTWKPLVARRYQLLRHERAHRLILSCLWDVVVPKPNASDLTEGGGSEVGRVLSWCAAGRWLRPWLRPVWTCLFPNVGRSWEILPRLESSTKKQLLLAWKIPAELHSRCFNCISYSDRVATCQSTRLCLRYHGFCHIARDCKRLRHAATSAAKGGDWPRPSTPRAS